MDTTVELEISIGENAEPRRAPVHRPRFLTRTFDLNPVVRWETWYAHQLTPLLVGSHT